MPANNQPIFTATPNVNATAVTAANTKSDGAGTIGTDIFLAWTAGANGGYIQKLRWIMTGTTANILTAANVGRTYLSTQASGATNAADTDMIDEQTLPAVTADSSTAGALYFDVPVNAPVPAGMTVLASCHIAQTANTAWKLIVFGGNY